MQSHHSLIRSLALVFYKCFIIVLTSSSLPINPAHAIAFQEVSSLHTWITVSSLANKDSNGHKSLIFRQIELNWINAPLEDGSDYIALYLDSFPDTSETLPVSVHKINGRPNGKIITDYYLPQIDFLNSTASHLNDQANFKRPNEPKSTLADSSDQLRNYRNIYNDQHQHHPILGGENENEARWLRRSPSLQPTNILRASPPQQVATGGGGGLSGQLAQECIGYCLAYHSRNRILSRNCLTTNPTWMRDSFPQLAARSLPSLMLPGTHNSATYARGPLDKSVLQMINKYQMNQDENIFNQLAWGIRYLDLRIGYNKVKSRPERLWVYHDIFRTEVSAEEVFEQIRRFLDMTTHELIIMDFHRFTVGFQNENTQTQRERHAKLTELLFRHLGQYLVPSYLGQHAPVQEYIGMGKRLLVGYSGRAQLLGSPSADQHHSIFGLYQASGSEQKNRAHSDPQKNKIRDMDAHKQDQEDGLRAGQNENENAEDSDGEDHQREEANQQSSQGNQSDRRMGTRIYNKLKSLRLVSHSFSKRSADTIESHKDRSKILVASKNSTQKSNKLLFDFGSEPSQDAARGAETDVARVALFFPSVRHLWPNKDTLEGLAQYMNETTCRRHFGELRSMMVELTPTVFGAISDKYDGNRKLAQLANRPVTDWIRDRWLHCINIVASDYFLGNDLIRLAIHANKRRVLNHRDMEPSTTSLTIGQNQQQLCRHFRKIEHLLDKSKVPIQFAYQPARVPSYEPEELGQVPMLGVNSIYVNKDDDLITHYSPSGGRILLRPLVESFNSLQTSSHSATPTGNGQAQARERRDSFVDNVSDGFADLFSSFKRLLNL